LDDRTIRAAIIVIGHVMWLSAAALRILRGQRRHWISERASWLVEHYTLLVWVPLVVATFLFTGQVELAEGWQLAGAAVALGGALFAAWAMWSLGRAYGIRTDLFEGHTLKTDGAFAVVRHPMYLGAVVYHVGASLALESVGLLLITALFVLPYTSIRIGAEERVLRSGFGPAWDAYAVRVPALLPVPR
jgi:protein-S-isoprenylcysteine O-methyltransferase Ste14